MADEQKREESGQSNESSKPKKRLKPMLIVAAMLVGEGVAIFALMSALSPKPMTTMAAEDEKAMADPLNLDGRSELVICSVDAFNGKEGRLYAYQVELSALVATENLEIVKRFIEVRGLSIRDRIQEVIRAADPQQLNDPSLGTIKRQMKFELNNLLGKDLIDEVLISRLLQSRTSL